MSSNNSNNNAADYTSGGGHSRTRGQHSNENQVKEAIIDLYLKVKIRSKDEVSKATNSKPSDVLDISTFLSSLFESLYDYLR